MVRHTSAHPLCSPPSAPSLAILLPNIIAHSPSSTSSDHTQSVSQSNFNVPCSRSNVRPMRQGITKMIKLVALTRPYIIQESHKKKLEGMHRTASCYCLLQGQFHLQKYPTLKEGPYMIRDSWRVICNKQTYPNKTSCSWSSCPTWLPNVETLWLPLGFDAAKAVNHPKPS